MHRRGLHKWSVHRGHGLAAILTVAAARRTVHRLAALHRLFWRRRGLAVECIYSQSDVRFLSRTRTLNALFPIGQYFFHISLPAF